MIAIPETKQELMDALYEAFRRIDKLEKLNLRLENECDVLDRQLKEYQNAPRDNSTEMGS